MMNKLIIGCGYLGRRVAERWRGLNCQVFATTRKESHALEFQQFGWRPIVCDVLDPASLRDLPRADNVLYCIGFDRTSKATMREVYVEGLRNVLERLPRPKRFIHVSSTSVYGQCDGSLVDEASPTEPLGESGRIVLDAERLLHDQLPEAVILRFAGIYGPDRGIRKEAIAKGEPLKTNPNRWLNLIHVEDGAEAVLAAETHARPGESYNICDDSPVRKGDFYRHMAKLMAAPEPRFAPLTEPVPERERINRRIDARKMKKELQVRLAFPNYKKGLSQ